ncbi:ABC transporter permease [Clostridium saccharobutylicum]|uniref:ABC-2 family transporter protein n=1 Tax=Clostridium saccharobutylicum TaxID=169679 RepID=A0A1S8NI06_CLOSA|nr:ABC transporter permease [Clostridium saccharobutylicum]OOM16070.1 ABC-2 family transporter protein [Clostridium saccharobutylicum]
MNNLIRGEFYKLRKSKYFIGMMIVAVIVGVLLICQWEHEGKNQFPVANGVNSISYTFFLIIFISCVFALLAGGFIVNDFKNGNINKNFSYGYRRNKIILSKLIVFIIFSLIIELIYTTILVIYVSVNYGFCEVLDLSTFLYLTRIISIGIIYNLATICIIAMIAIITKSIFCTFVSPVVLFIIFLIAFPMESYPYISNIFSYMPYVSGMRAVDNFSSKADIIRCIASSMLTFIITIVGSLLYVEYEDVK